MLFLSFPKIFKTGLSRLYYLCSDPSSYCCCTRISNRIQYFCLDDSCWLLQQTNFHKLNRLILSKFTVVCIVFCLSILPVFLCKIIIRLVFHFIPIIHLLRSFSNISYLSGLERAYLSLLQFPNQV